MALEQIKGIGPATVKKLADAGVRTLDDLRNLDVDAVAEKTGLAPERLREWRTEAKLIKVLDDIKGLGPATKRKLQKAGIHNLDDLARATAHELAHATRLAQDRIKAWQADAQRLLKEAESRGNVAVTKGRQAAQKAQAAAHAAKEKGEAIAKDVKQKSEAIAKDVKGRVDDFRHPTSETKNGAKPGLRARIKKFFQPREA